MGGDARSELKAANDELRSMLDAAGRSNTIFNDADREAYETHVRDLWIANAHLAAGLNRVETLPGLLEDVFDVLMRVERERLSDGPPYVAISRLKDATTLCMFAAYNESVVAAIDLSKENTDLRRDVIRLQRLALELEGRLRARHEADATAAADEARNVSDGLGTITVEFGIPGVFKVKRDVKVDSVKEAGQRVH